MSKMGVKRGFTIVEMLLSLMIIALLSSLSFPFIRTFQIKNDLDVATNVLVQTYRRAQSLAMSGESDSQWGVSIITGEIVLYRGSSYVTRTVDSEESYNISSAIVASGVTDIAFSKLTGTPSATGATLLTSEDTKTVTINEKGIVNY